MSKYQLVFYYPKYHPEIGWKDFNGIFSSLVEAKEKALELSLKSADGFFDLHVINLETYSVVFKVSVDANDFYRQTHRQPETEGNEEWTAYIKTVFSKASENYPEEKETEK